MARPRPAWCHQVLVEMRSGMRRWPRVVRALETNVLMSSGSSAQPKRPNANIFGFGAVNGWTMICAERPLAAANDANFTAVQTHLGGSRARVRRDPHPRVGLHHEDHQHRVPRPVRMPCWSKGLASRPRTAALDANPPEVTTWTVISLSKVRSCRLHRRRPAKPSRGQPPPGRSPLARSWPSQRRADP